MMSGTNSYWMSGSEPPTPASPESGLDRSHSPRYGNPIPAPSGSYNRLSSRPPTMVAIHPDSSIYLLPRASSTCNGGIHNIIAHNVSAVQHVPPSQQRQYNTSDGGYNLASGEHQLQEITSSSHGSELAEVPSEPVNYRDDIKLDDKALVTISTKELNRRLKKEGVTKQRQKEIKSERRTLKNRGYASNCRVSREEEERRLEREIAEMQKQIESMPPDEVLESQYREAKHDVRILQNDMGLSISDTSSESDADNVGSIKEEDMSNTDEGISDGSNSDSAI